MKIVGLSICAIFVLACLYRITENQQRVEFRHDFPKCVRLVCPA